MKIEVRGVSFDYGSFRALEDVEVKVGAGEVASLVGPNGSGKTTLLKCIGKILKPKMGVVMIDGREIGDFDSREIAKLVGYVPQSSPQTLHLTVFDAVLLGRKPYISLRVGERDKEIVSEILVSLRLEELAGRFFDELSGGERQKVLIARALAQEPEVLLLDEPTSNLDLRHQLEVMKLIQELVKERGLSAVIAIHDLNLAARFSDKLIFLKRGKILAAGRPEEVLTSEIIREVYGVSAFVLNHSQLQKPYIVPVSPC